MNNLQQWMLENLEVEDIIDIINYGIDENNPYFGKYMQTSALYDIFHEEIWEIASQHAVKLNKPNTMHMIGDSLLDNPEEKITEAWEFERWMVWFAMEQIANKIAHEE